MLLDVQSIFEGKKFTNNSNNNKNTNNDTSLLFLLKGIGNGSGDLIWAPPWEWDVGQNLGWKLRFERTLGWDMGL